MTDVELKLCRDCGGKKRWYPTSIAQLDTFLSPHIKQTSAVKHGYAIRKNICYGIQYLQYLDETLQQLRLSEVLITMTYKQFVVTGIAIIEGVLYNQLKSKDLLRTNEWEVVKESESPEIALAGATIRTETRVLRKREVPVEEETSFDRLLRIAERKKVLGADSTFYAKAHHLRKLRNKVHLFVTAHELDSDWNAFGVKEFKLMKHALFILLTGPPFFPNDTQREVFAFLADN